MLNGDLKCIDGSRLRDQLYYSLLPRIKPSLSTLLHFPTIKSLTISYARFSLILKLTLLVQDSQATLASSRNSSHIWDSSNTFRTLLISRSYISNSTQTSKKVVDIALRPSAKGLLRRKYAKKSRFLTGIVGHSDKVKSTMLVWTHLYFQSSWKRFFPAKTFASIISKKEVSWEPLELNYQQKRRRRNNLRKTPTET